MFRHSDTSVHRLKEEFPHLDIEIGGIKTMAQAQEQLEHVDAVMIGRAAYDNPWQFVDADRFSFGVTITIYQHVEKLPRRCLSISKSR